MEYNIIIKTKTDYKWIITPKNDRVLAFYRYSYEAIRKHQKTSPDRTCPLAKRVEDGSTW